MSEPTYLERLKLAVGCTLSRDEKFDFRTPESLARELNYPVSDVRWALWAMTLNGMVRHPILADKRYDDWWRWAPRGLTRLEKWARLRAYIAHDFYALREDTEQP